MYLHGPIFDRKTLSNFENTHTIFLEKSQLPKRKLNCEKYILTYIVYLPCFADTGWDSGIKRHVGETTNDILVKHSKSSPKVDGLPFL